MENQQEAWWGNMGICGISLSSSSEYSKNCIEEEPNVPVSAPKGTPAPACTGPGARHCNTGAHCSQSVPLDHSQPSPHSNLAMLLRQEGNSNFPGPRWIPVLLLFVVKPWKPSSKSQHTCRQSPSKHTAQGSEAPRAHQKHLEGRKRTAPSWNSSHGF